nr:hypothetical protein [uncultured Duganella sp.]
MFLYDMFVAPPAVFFGGAGAGEVQLILERFKQHESLKDARAGVFHPPLAGDIDY